MANGKTTAPVEKRLTPTEQNTKDIKDLKAGFDSLNSKLEQLLGFLANGVKPENEEPEEVVPAKTSEPAPALKNDYKITAADEITFVHLIQRAEGLCTFVQLPTWELRLTLSGEIFSLSKAQADEFVGKYRTWFDNGIFAVGNDDISIKYAELKKIKPAKNYAVSNYNLEQIGNLDYSELEDLMLKVAPAHRDNIIEYFKQKLYKGMHNVGARDVRFFDLRKLEILNRVSGCDSLKYDIEEVKNLK